MTIIKGKLQDPTGDAVVSWEVNAELVAASPLLTLGGEIVTTDTVTTDAEGDWQFDLVPVSQLAQPTGAYYKLSYRQPPSTTWVHLADVDVPDTGEFFVSQQTVVPGPLPELAASQVGLTAEVTARTNADISINAAIDNLVTGKEILVAASDAAVSIKDIALFVCDGTDDDEVIQSAIAQAVSLKLPVRLSGGTFNIAQSIQIPASLSMLGMGVRQTTLMAITALDDYILEFDNTVVGGISAARFADFTFDGNAANQDAGGGLNALGAIDSVFERLRFRNCYEWGMILGPYESGAGFGHHNDVRCLFEATILSAGAGGGLFLTSSDENTVQSHFSFLGGAAAPDGLPRPVALYDKAGLNKIMGSVFVGGQDTSNCDHIRIRDVKMTQVLGCTSDGSAGHAVIATGTRHVIANNTLTSVGDQGTISGGAIGVFVDFAGKAMTITGNSIDSSETANKTRSLIHCTGDGDAGSNIIKDNVLWVNGALQQTPVENSGVANIVADNIIGPIV